MLLMGWFLLGSPQTEPQPIAAAALAIAMLAVTVSYTGASASAAQEICEKLWRVSIMRLGDFAPPPPPPRPLASLLALVLAGLALSLVRPVRASASSGVAVLLTGFIWVTSASGTSAPNLRVESLVLCYSLVLPSVGCK